MVDKISLMKFQKVPFEQVSVLDYLDWKYFTFIWILKHNLWIFSLYLLLIKLTHIPDKCVALGLRALIIPIVPFEKSLQNKICLWIVLVYHLPRFECYLFEQLTKLVIWALRFHQINLFDFIILSFLEWFGVREREVWWKGW